MLYNPDYNFRERATGYPNPSQYDQYYINNYSLPKGLNVFHSKIEKQQKVMNGLYDLKMPKHRSGIAGWKLTRRNPETPQSLSESYE